MKRFISLNKHTCLILLMLVMLTGCSTVKIEMAGMPAPDHIKQFRVLGLNLIVNTTCAYFYNEAEDDEYLETFKYIGSSDGVTNIKEKNLSNVKLICRINNPEKKFYTLKVLHEVYNDKGKLLMAVNHKIYDGNLSLKNFSENLSKVAGFEHKIWLRIYDKQETLRYQDIVPLRYKILAT